MRWRRVGLRNVRFRSLVVRASDHSFEDILVANPNGALPRLAHCASHLERPPHPFVRLYDPSGSWQVENELPLAERVSEHVTMLRHVVENLQSIMARLDT